LDEDGRDALAWSSKVHDFCTQDEREDKRGMLVQTHCGRVEVSARLQLPTSSEPSRQGSWEVVASVLKMAAGHGVGIAHSTLRGCCEDLGEVKVLSGAKAGSPGEKGQQGERALHLW
jgi:hypothetical protein